MGKTAEFEPGSDRLRSKEARQAVLRRMLQVRDQFARSRHAGTVIDRIQILTRAHTTGGPLHDMELSIRRGATIMALLNTVCGPDPTDDDGLGCASYGACP